MTSSIVIMEEIPDCMCEGKMFIIPIDDIKEKPDIMTAIEDINRTGEPTPVLIDWLNSAEIRQKYILLEGKIIPSFKATMVININMGFY